MTDAQIPATHPAAVMAKVMVEIETSRANLVRENAFETAQDLRVSLRRLRSGLTLFRPLISPEHQKALLEDARWLAAEVTRLRDLYLLAQDTLTPARVALPNNSALEALENQVTATIHRERETLSQLFEEDRYKAMIATGNALGDPEIWRPGAADTQRVEALCQDTLATRLNQAIKYGESLKRLDPNSRDSFRKSLRKLRATAEFSQSMFANKKTKAFLKQLKKLLDSMVAARDASAVRDTLEWLVADMDADAPERHIAMELIKAKVSGVTLDNKRLQKQWRATIALPAY